MSCGSSLWREVETDIECRTVQIRLGDLGIPVTIIGGW